MKTLEEIKKVVESLASVIDAPPIYLPLFGEEQPGKVDIQIHDNKYLYVLRPRFIHTNNEDELLFAVFADLTEHMGLLYAIENNPDNSEPRQKGYEHQLKLLQKINLAWKMRREAEIEEELKHYPYKDEL